MDTLDIPLVNPETTIQDALDQMQLLGRCGLVVQRPGASELVYVGQVLEARDAGLTAVGQIADGVPILDANSAGVGTAALDLEQPQRTWQAYENLFTPTRSGPFRPSTSWRRYGRGPQWWSRLTMPRGAHWACWPGISGQPPSICR